MTKVGGKNGFKIDARNAQGSTALALCSIAGHEKVSRLLLDAEADVNLHDREQMSPAMHAASLGHVNVVKALLASTADVAKRDKQGYRIMEHAREQTEMRTAVMALQRVNFDLLTAVQRNSTDIVRQALEEGAHVDAKDDYG